RPEADQCLAAVRTITRNPVYAGQVLAEAGIVVYNDHDRDVATARLFQFGEVIVETTIAGKTEHRAVPSGAFRAEGRRKGPAERAGRAQIGLPSAIQLDHRTGPDAGIAGIGHEDPIRGQGAGHLGADAL